MRLVSICQAAEPRCATSAPELNAPLSFPPSCFHMGPLMSLVPSLCTERANTLTAPPPLPTVAHTLVICACQCPTPVTLRGTHTHTKEKKEKQKKVCCGSYSKVLFYFIRYLSNILLVLTTCGHEPVSAKLVATLGWHVVDSVSIHLFLLRCHFTSFVSHV